MALFFVSKKRECTKDEIGLFITMLDSNIRNAGIKYTLYYLCPESDLF